MDLYGNQAVIDSTGIAQGVLRRIKVRIPLDEKNSNYQFPDFAIAAADICKQLQIAYSTTNLCDPPGQRFDGIVASCSATRDIVLVMDRSSSMNKL